jgi:hypothetical protein
MVVETPLGDGATLGLCTCVTVRPELALHANGRDVRVSAFLGKARRSLSGDDEPNNGKRRRSEEEARKVECGDV